MRLPIVGISLLGISLLGISLLGISLTQCGTVDSDRSIDPGVPVEVLNSVPADLATRVDPEAMIEIQFSQAIDPTTFNATTVQLLHQAEFIPLQHGYEAMALRGVLVPDAPLEPGTDYELLVGTGVRDEAGRRLERGYAVHFITACESAHPVPDGLYVCTPATGSSAADTLRILESCGTVIARGTLTCRAASVTLTRTVSGELDESHRFSLDDTDSFGSMQVVGSFIQQAGSWCVESVVHLRVSVPGNEGDCLDDWTFEPVCR